MVLFLNSSPRKTGVTSSLLKIIADEARSAGAEVEWVDVNKLSIRPCIGCLKCRPDKKCILPPDDGHRIGELVERCSGLVIGAPTYWGNMPASLKMLFERIVPVLEYYELWGSCPYVRARRKVCSGKCGPGSSLLSRLKRTNWA